MGLADVGMGRGGLAHCVGITRLGCAMRREMWFWAGVLLALVFWGMRADALTWVLSPGGNYVAYDSNTGALYNGNSAASNWGNVVDVMSNGSLSTTGESWLSNMPVLDVADSSVGELALTGVEMTAAIGTDGLSALATKAVQVLWGAQLLNALLQDLGANAINCSSTGTLCNTSGSGGNYCSSAEVWDGDVYGTNAQTGALEPIDSVCTMPASENNGHEVTGCIAIPSGASSTCPAGVLGGTPTTTTAAETDITDYMLPSSSNYDTMVNDLKNIVQNWPGTVPTPDVAGDVADSYSGPSSVSGPTTTVTTNGQTDTISSTATPSYSPQGVTPNVENTTCTGTGSCSTAPSQTTPPFVPPMVNLPNNPALPSKGVPLSLNVSPVSGTCPPPIALDLASVDMGSYNISLQPMCTLAGYVQPVIDAAAGVAAGFIILQ